MYMSMWRLYEQVKRSEVFIFHVFNAALNGKKEVFLNGKIVIAERLAQHISEMV